MILCLHERETGLFSFDSVPVVCDYLLLRNIMAEQSRIQHETKMSKVREVSLFISHWHSQLPSLLKGTLWNFNWHHSICQVLMSISQTVFNSLAASLLTPTRNFKGALLWIPLSCIKNVNLGDMLTTRSRMLPNSNEDSDQSRQERRNDLTMPSACQSVHLSITLLLSLTFYISFTRKYTIQQYLSFSL